MSFYGEKTRLRRVANARSLAAFGISNPESEPQERIIRVRQGNGTKVYTIGYEGRDGVELLEALSTVGIEVLVDIRERPMSRKADFRRSALETRCMAAGVAYESWPELGSTEPQRAELKESGDFDAFRRRFGAFVRRYRNEHLIRLAELAKKSTVALLCYERDHAECHRAIVADWLGDELNATVYAIM